MLLKAVEAHHIIHVPCSAETGAGFADEGIVGLEERKSSRTGTAEVFSQPRSWPAAMQTQGRIQELQKRIKERS
jgi:hypothetical protein